MEERVERLATAARNRGGVLFQWRGSHPVEEFVFLNMLFLHVLWTEEGTVRYRRLAGHRFRSGKAHRTVFHASLVRVTTGSRARKLFFPEDLMSEEKAHPAGVFKILAPGREPDRIRDTAGDSSLLDVVEDMLSAETTAAGGLVVPEVYVSGESPEDFSPRVCGELVDVLKHAPGYDKDADFSANFRKCFDKCFARLSNGKWVVKASMAGGRGAAMADLGSLSGVFETGGSVERLRLDTEDWQIRIV